MCKFCDIEHLKIEDEILERNFHTGEYPMLITRVLKYKPLDGGRTVRKVNICIQTEDNSQAVVYEPKFCPECGRDLSLMTYEICGKMSFSKMIEAKSIEEAIEIMNRIPLSERLEDITSSDICFAENINTGETREW